MGGIFAAGLFLSISPVNVLLVGLQDKFAVDLLRGSGKVLYGVSQELDYYNQGLKVEQSLRSAASIPRQP